MKLRRVSRAGAEDAIGPTVVEAVGGRSQIARIAKLAVYLPADSKSAHDDLRAELETIGYSGATETVSLEPLEHREQALVAAWLVEPGTALHVPTPDVTLARGAGFEVAWFGNGGAADYAEVLAGAEHKLSAAGMGVAQLWKTWSYLPVDPSTGNADEAFIAFNKYRASWFGGVVFDIAAAAADMPCAYPANTGVGDLGGRFGLSGIAGRVSGGTGRVFEIENPTQQAPRQYGSGSSGRRTPAHFSRAVGVLGDDGHRWVLVAGTASVVGSNTARIGAAAEQAVQTLTNLAVLAAEADHPAAPRPAPRPIEEVYRNLVVYIVHAEHYEAVRSTVSAMAPGIPVTYLRCPLTRTDFLVEMEGELI